MSIHPADSQVFGALYTTDEIRTLFSDHAHLQLMVDIEAALNRSLLWSLRGLPTRSAARPESRTCGSITLPTARAESAIL
jgi:hypothetical protein